MNRSEMLQKLRNESRAWFVGECNLTNGWKVMKDFDTHDFIVCHTMHDPITRADWQQPSIEARVLAAKVNDAVKKPSHYQMIDGVESIEIIASCMTRDEWRGFCMGNELKYRLRAGKKDALQQDIDKANEYGLLFEKHKELNRYER